MGLPNPELDKRLADSSWISLYAPTVGQDFDFASTYFLNESSSNGGSSNALELKMTSLEDILLTKVKEGSLEVVTAEHDDIPGTVTRLHKAFRLHPWLSRIALDEIDSQDEHVTPRTVVSMAMRGLFVATPFAFGITQREGRNLELCAQKFKSFETTVHKAMAISKHAVVSVPIMMQPVPSDSKTSLTVAIAHDTHNRDSSNSKLYVPKSRKFWEKLGDWSRGAN